MGTVPGPDKGSGVSQQIADKHIRGMAQAALDKAKAINEGVGAVADVVLNRKDAMSRVSQGGDLASSLTEAVVRYVNDLEGVGTFVYTTDDQTGGTGGAVVVPKEKK